MPGFDGTGPRGLGLMTGGAVAIAQTTTLAHLAALPILVGPLREDLSERVITDLERTRPALLVYPSDLPPPTDHPVGRYLRQHYGSSQPRTTLHGFTIESRR